MPDAAGRTLVLVERAAAVPRALELRRADPDGTVLLAVGAEAFAPLEAAGAAYATPEDHVTPAEVARRGAENYAALEDLGGRVGALLGALPEPLRLNPVHLHYYRLKVFFDSVGLRVLELAAVLRALRPREVVVLSGPDDPLWAEPGAIHFMTHDGPVYAALAPFVAAALSVPVRNEAVAAAGRPRPQRRLRALAGGARRAVRLLASLARGARPGALWQLGDRAHDIPALWEALSRRVPGVAFENAFAGPLGGLVAARPGPGDRAAAARFWDAAAAVLAGHPALAFGGVDCFPFVRETLRRLFTVEQLEAARLYRGLRRLVRLARPRAALTVNTPYPANVVASWALRAEGVPVVYAQEGGLYGYCETPMHHYCELSWGDHFLSYGEGCAAHVNGTRLTPRQTARAVPVGAFRLRRAPVLPPPAAPPRTVLYAASNFHHNVRYAPLCYGEREYYRLRRAILEALLASPFEKIIYKAVPGTLAGDALRPFLERHRGRIEACDAPLGVVMGRGDRIVVDWPTTTLLEALASGRPVDVLLDAEAARPLAGALPALRRRARVHLTPAELLAALPVPDGPGPDDDTFLAAYGTGGAAAWDEARLAEFFAALPARTL